MGKSYKKTPIIKDNKKARKYFKRLANKQVRRYSKPLANGKAYRKVFDSWDIYDWITRETWEDNLRSKESLEKEIANGTHRWGIKVTEDWLESYSRNSWEKYYKRK